MRLRDILKLTPAAFALTLVVGCGEEPATTPASTTTGDKIERAAGDAAKTIGDAGKDAAKAVDNAVDKAVDKAADATAKAADAVKDKVEAGADAVKDAVK